MIRPMVGEAVRSLAILEGFSETERSVSSLRVSTHDVIFWNARLLVLPQYSVVARGQVYCYE